MTSNRPAVPRVLSIAGTDPTGGAGIQADLKSIAANGGYGMAVVTALVAQNTQGVRTVHTPPADFLRQQLEAVSDDVVIDAVKIGMLGEVPTIEVVRAWLERVRPPVVVLDPVMVATSGDRLLAAEAEQAVRDLLPAADLITPNVPELAVLAGQDPAATWDGVVAQALAVSERYGVAVLAKGGHLQGDLVHDALVDAAAPDTVRPLAAPRVDTRATHGTGCSLSSAVATWQGAAVLGGGGDWFASVDRAKQWLTESLRHGAALEVGQGHGPVSHFAGLWDRGGVVTRVTSDWWEQIEEVRDGTDADPFVAGLAAGSLPREAFGWYLAQDAEYLHAYAEVLARTAELADDPAEAAFWAAGSAECLEEELRLHQQWTGGGRVDPAPATVAYVDHLRRAAESGYAEAVAAVLPCYWMYADIGARLAAAVTDDHPYRDWLLTYGDPAFAVAAARARAITDRVAADPATTPEVRDRMWQAFATSAHHERAFFAAALTPPT
ncbi:MAG: bifunctional hydroxymethylpyrimidine kinase/phosphomethylpyrimidine kinase [Aeromicrobium sp.]|uniref:bifunctional hydroxymethylpyrimidine kinase/phosphomethylpyrimidine kinase n=1 Tax=Aeromicrobium sp. TaxID=1871063 RepID=UPI0025BDB866|nr:bifunctional hydroxymethylpyrimidine kinase/phosphomethylpyrimidine kinase [Aeromicrobium sp.]MCK5891474.1 bifunctional hydroxymethylpyrimidine kinase/phosphomethylpyrimidine kinase [Aeromicrobium sp.]MDF1704715.1 bifunctional hydroxymethylpyrimidine kinase/phosphomethylpyrimidine kinase [Aeromicrobium sp.]